MVQQSEASALNKDGCLYKIRQYKHCHLVLVMSLGDTGGGGKPSSSGVMMFLVFFMNWHNVGNLHQYPAVERINNDAQPPFNSIK